LKALSNALSVLLNYTLFGVLMLLSLLPMPVLYGLSRVLTFFLYYVIGYRKKVVYKNLENSLAEGVSIKKTARQFYFFLGEIFLETIKCMSIRKGNLLRRITCDNPEVMEQFAAEGRSVMLMSGHYGNWELLIYAMNLMFPHWAIGVGKPLSNKVLNKLINGKRARFGMKIINASNIKEEFANDKEALTAALFLADQYPGGAKKGFPATFLNKPSYFMYGAEKYAIEYNNPVVYGDITRIRRGHYNIHLVVISENPASSAYGDIMSQYTHLMEQTILRQPAYWLWSHKRWKDIEGFY
jgi:Kdo2-lipid IVA lauroyltransferase/acyltransferase